MPWSEASPWRRLQLWHSGATPLRSTQRKAGAHRWPVGRGGGGLKTSRRHEKSIFLIMNHDSMCPLMMLMKMYAYVYYIYIAMRYVNDFPIALHQSPIPWQDRHLSLELINPFGFLRVDPGSYLHQTVQTGLHVPPAAEQVPNCTEFSCLVRCGKQLATQ